jgi:hypothetical protein
LTRARGRKAIDSIEAEFGDLTKQTIEIPFISDIGFLDSAAVNPASNFPPQNGSSLLHTTAAKHNVTMWQKVSCVWH